MPVTPKFHCQIKNTLILLKGEIKSQFKIVYNSLLVKILKSVTSKRGCCHGDPITVILHGSQLDNCG